MKRWYILAALLLVVTLGAGFQAGRGWAAAAAEPGSPEDPLVAKSYVDKLTRVQVLELKAGQTLRAGAGTEIILRSGRVVAVSAPGGGIADLTAGRDIKSGEAVSANHLLLVPRSDGRGLKALTPAVVLVRGDANLE